MSLIPIPDPPGVWAAEALCAGDDVTNWFPQLGRGSGSEAEQRRRAAPLLAVCEACPVIVECRAYAIRNRIVDGVWGGLTEAGLRRVQQTRVTVGGGQADHGSRSRYQSGCRCGECQAANAGYLAELRAEQADPANVGGHLLPVGVVDRSVLARVGEWRH